MIRKPRGNLLYAFALSILSSAVFVMYILLALQNPFHQLEPMINGTATRPFVYRVLTPILVRIISDVSGASPHLGATFIMYLSLLGFSWSISALAEIFLSPQYSRPFSLLAPVGLVPFVLWQRHIYDFPTLFLFTLALYFLAKRDFGKYLLTFVLATLSKETSLFLTLFFAIQFRKMERRSFLFLVSTQAFVYILIRLALIALFRNNPGSILEFHAYDQLEAILQYPLNATMVLGAIISIIWFGMVYPQDKCNFVRNSLFVTGGPTLLLYFFFGMPFEVRVFLEVYPSIFLMTSLMAISLINRCANAERRHSADLHRV